jgi:hypothetical protein
MVNATTSTNSNTTDSKQQQSAGMRGMEMWDKRGSFFGSLPRPHLPHVGSSTGGGIGSAFANLNLSVNSNSATATAASTASTAAGTGTASATAAGASSGATSGATSTTATSSKKKKRPNVWAERPARPPSGHSMFSPFSVNTNRFRPPSFRNVSIPR